VTGNGNPMSIAYWKSWNERNRPPMGPEACFLVDHLIPRSPLMGDIGEWLWVADPREMAGFLRHLAVPMATGDWPGRQEWDDHANSTITIEELIQRGAGAEEAIKHRERWDAFLALARMLGEIGSLPVSGAASALQECEGRFDALFADGPHAAYEIRILQGVPNYVEAGLVDLATR